MDPYVTEKEQIEVLRQWWVKNGTNLLLTLSVVFAAVAGYRYWQNGVYEAQLGASVQYTKMMDLMQQDKMDEAVALGDMIIQNASDTSYAPLAAFAVAKVQADKNEMTSARSHLTWIIEHSDRAEVKDVAQLRLARIFLAEKNYDQALKSADLVSDAEFKHVIAELKGDIYLAQGEKDKARTAYQEAVDAEKANAKIAKLKLEDLGSKS